jgi:hypothetical protein
MYTHPELLLDLAHQRHDELIAQARRFRLARAVRLHRSPEPERDPDLGSEKNVVPVGRLSVCEKPRELTAARAR